MVRAEKGDFALETGRLLSSAFRTGRDFHGGTEILIFEANSFQCPAVRFIGSKNVSPVNITPHSLHVDLRNGLIA